MWWLFTTNRRDRVGFSRQLIKQYLKQCIYRPSHAAAPWVVKPSIATAYSINQIDPKADQYVIKPVVKKSHKRVVVRFPSSFFLYSQSFNLILVISLFLNPGWNNQKWSASKTSTQDPTRTSRLHHHHHLHFNFFPHHTCSHPYPPLNSNSPRSITSGKIR